MMFGLHFGGKGERIVAVADIGSGSAAFALASLSRKGPARVLAAERILLPIEERAKEATIAAIAEQLVQAGEKAIKSVTANAGKAFQVQDVYCIIRAPWTRSKGVRGQTDLGGPKVVKRDMVSSLAKQVIAGDSGLDKSSIFESSVVGVELDGYAVADPDKKTAHELAVSVLLSDCDPGLRTAVVASLARLFPHHTPLLRSATRALLSYVRTMDNNQGDLLGVEVTSLASTLTTLRDGILDAQGAVPEGMHAVLKRVASAGMPEETLSLISMVSRDQCTSSACEAMKDAMGKTEPELMKLFGEAMAAMAASRRLPNRLLLLAHPDLLPWLTTFFQRIDFTQFTETLQPFAVETLQSSDLARFAVPAEKVKLDVGLALSVALVNRERGE